MRAVLALAGLDGLIAVAMGAFATHGLKAALPADDLALVETGSRYLLIHAAAALGVAAAGGRVDRRAGFLFGLGALFFALALYAIALAGWRWAGAAAPIGGLGMIAGWGLVLWSGLSAGTK